MADFSSSSSRRSPAPRTSFQRELEQKMRERQRAGLAADVSDSAHGSDSELDDDDELLAGFNMTSSKRSAAGRHSPMQNGRGPGSSFESRRSPSDFGRKSPYDKSGRSAVDELFGRKTPTNFGEEEENADLMMTMRKPWAPPGSRKTNDDLKTASPKDRRQGGGHQQQQPWQPPSLRKAPVEEQEEEEEEPWQPQRPKSPSKPFHLESIGSSSKREHRSKNSRNTSLSKGASLESNAFPDFNNRSSERFVNQDDQVVDKKKRKEKKGNSKSIEDSDDSDDIVVGGNNGSFHDERYDYDRRQKNDRKTARNEFHEEKDVHKSRFSSPNRSADEKREKFRKSRSKGTYYDEEGNFGSKSSVGETDNRHSHIYVQKSPSRRDAGRKSPLEDVRGGERYRKNLYEKTREERARKSPFEEDSRGSQKSPFTNDERISEISDERGMKGYKVDGHHDRQKEVENTQTRKDKHSGTDLSTYEKHMKLDQESRAAELVSRSHLKYGGKYPNNESSGYERYARDSQKRGMKKYNQENSMLDEEIEERRERRDHRDQKSPFRELRESRDRESPFRDRRESRDRESLFRDRRESREDASSFRQQWQQNRDQRSLSRDSSLEGVRGRRTPVDLDAIEEDSGEKPQPKPRGGKQATAAAGPKPKPRSRFDKEEEEEEEFVRKNRKTPTSDIFGSSRSLSKTPTKDVEKKTESKFMKGKSVEKEGRKTPTGKKTPEKKSILDEMEGDSKKKKKSRGLLKDEDSDDSCDREPGTRKLGRKSPYEEGDRYGRKSPFDADRGDRYGRKSPFDAERSDKYGRSFDNDRDKYGRKSPFDADRGYKGRESPFDDRRGGRRGDDEFDGRAPDRYGRKSPFESDRGDRYGRKSPFERDRHEEDEDYFKSRMRRKKSRDEEDDDDDYGYSKRDVKAKDEPLQRSERKPRSKSKSAADERESSVCRDVEQDPGPMRKPDTMEGQELKKKQVKHQTSEKQLLDNVIDSIKDAQGKDATFRPVEPDNDDQDNVTYTPPPTPVPPSQPPITPRSSTTSTQSSKPPVSPRTSLVNKRAAYRARRHAQNTQSVEEKQTTSAAENKENVKDAANDNNTNSVVESLRDKEDANLSKDEVDSAKAPKDSEAKVRKDTKKHSIEPDSKPQPKPDESPASKNSANRLKSSSLTDISSSGNKGTRTSSSKLTKSHTIEKDNTQSSPDRPRLSKSHTLPGGDSNHRSPTNLPPGVFRASDLTSPPGNPHSPPPPPPTDLSYLSRTPHKPYLYSRSQCSCCHQNPGLGPRGVSSSPGLGPRGVSSSPGLGSRGVSSSPGLGSRGVSPTMSRSLSCLSQSRSDAADKNKTGKVHKHAPKPRYAKPMIETFPVATSPTSDFNSTVSIKDAIYLEWFKAKQERAKKELAEKKKQEKEEEEKKKQAEEEKAMEAQLSYRAWMEKKKDFVSSKKKREAKERAKKQKEEEEKLEKTKEAEMSYKSWKEEKDARLREEKRKKEREEERKRQQEEEKKMDKEKDAKSAFNGWKEKKDVVIKSSRRSQRDKDREKEEEEKDEKQYAEEEAREAYVKWMEAKEKQMRRNKRIQREKTLRDMESPRPPFSPAGKHVIVR